MYNPPIKNLQELIRDISLVSNDMLSILEFVKKMEDLNYEHNVIDGFEDIIDILRPKFKKLLKIKRISNGRILTNSEKAVLERIIFLLKGEKSLKEIEDIEF